MQEQCASTMRVWLVLILALSTLTGVTYCQPTPAPDPEVTSCSQHGDLRLVHKQGNNFGVLQVCRNDTGANQNEWRYIVIWGWTERAARLACWQLGLPHLDPVTSTLRLKLTAYKVRRVEGCENAVQLNNCIRQFDINFNSNFDLVAVNCSNGPFSTDNSLECSTESTNIDMAECTRGSIRLVGGVLHNEGRLEACYNGGWGTVCGEGWTQRDVDHVCSRLGYPAKGTLGSSYGEGDGQIYDLTCFNSTRRCQRAQLTPSSCNHSQDLGLRCQTYREAFQTACNTRINERLSSLTTAMPRECPTQPATTINNLSEMTECPVCSTTDSESQTEATGISDGSRNTLNNSNTSTLLAALLGLLGVILAVVLVGWIMTSVYLNHKANRQTKSISAKVTTSDTGLNNPVYDTSAPPPHTTYSSLGPSYENNQGAMHEYDILSRPHPQNRRPRPPATLPGPREHEYSVLEGPAHTPSGGVVEGTYSLVGENNPQDYEVPTPTTERQGIN